MRHPLLHACGILVKEGGAVQVVLCVSVSVSVSGLVPIQTS